MNEPTKLLTAEQSGLVAELVENYNLEPEEIYFFDNNPKPFFSYEGAASLCSQLTDLAQIGVEPVSSPFPDSVAVKCSLLTVNGREISAVGVANRGEKIDDSDISEQQAITLASSRALRHALKAAGIDLLKLHAARNGQVVDFKTKSSKASLIAEAHALGTRVGLILNNDKTGWRVFLAGRYGVDTCSAMQDESLSDLVAVLRTLLPHPVAA